MHIPRPSKLTLLVIALFFCFGGIALAQDELTLESLRDRLVELEDRFTGYENRLTNIEDQYADPWSPDVIYKDDGICQSPLHASHEWVNVILANIHQQTADAYRSSYGVSIDPSDADLISISFGVGSSNVYLEYAISGRIVVEKWSHCDYLGHSEWSDDN